MATRPDYGLVVIAASAGGLPALQRVLSSLPARFPLPIAVVQHRTARRPDPLLEILNQWSTLPVKAAIPGQPILPGSVYLARPDLHLIVNPDRTFGLTDGGRIRFGPDGLLYITTGDAANTSLAQDVASLAGKILRINKDATTPRTNPFGSPVFSFGHRNPQGLDWHPATGDLWASEHGNVNNDEINVIDAGANYGWPRIEAGQSMPGMRTPVTFYNPAIAPTAIAPVALRTLCSPGSGDSKRPNTCPPRRTVNAVTPSANVTSVACQSAPSARPNVWTRLRTIGASAAASGLSTPSRVNPARGTRFTSRRKASRTASRSA